MNRIVRDHYPISALPADLRADLPVDLPADGEVRITLEVDFAAPEDTTEPVEPVGHFSRFKHLVRPRFSSLEEINAHVRALRGEWDHR